MSIPASDNIDAWIEISEPLRDFIAEEPRTQPEVNRWLLTQPGKGRAGPMAQALDWLDMRGLIKRFDGKWMTAERYAQLLEQFPPIPAPPPEPDHEPDEDDDQDAAEAAEEKTVAQRPTDLKTAAEIGRLVGRSVTWAYSAHLNRYPGPRGEGAFSEAEALRAIERSRKATAKGQATLAKIEEKLERKAAAKAGAKPKEAEGEWISSTEAGRRMGIHPVGIRQLALKGKIERKEAPARASGGHAGYVYNAAQVAALAVARGAPPKRTSSVRASSAGKTARKAAKAPRRSAPARSEPAAPSAPAEPPPPPPEGVASGSSPLLDFLNSGANLVVDGFLSRAKFERILRVLVEG